jgi:hypothetical protein
MFNAERRYPRPAGSIFGSFSRPVTGRRDMRRQMLQLRLARLEGLASDARSLHFESTPLECGILLAMESGEAVHDNFKLSLLEDLAVPQSR